MNFVRNVTVAGNSLVENASGTPHALPVSSLERFDGSIGGRELVLGVRPQDVAVTPVSSGGDLRGKVELIQLVGSEKLLDLALPSGARITAEVRAELPVAMGQDVGVRFDPERVHLFDAGTEANVLA
jgi:ABC-type sugar transport system ATPase subunit